MIEFGLGVLASLLAALLYGVFFSKFEQAIRSKLTAARSGWIRNRYVRIFIGAVRGEARAEDSKFLVQLLVIFPYALFFLIIIEQANVNTLSTKMDAMLDGKPSTATLDQQLQTLRELKPTMKILKLTLQGSLGAAIVWAVWLLGIQQPFVVFRSRFAYELERFSLRIQGLATKQELAELAQLESKVVDESSAHEYVTKMTQIAGRYGLDALVKTFVLWDSTEDSKA